MSRKNNNNYVKLMGLYDINAFRFVDIFASDNFKRVNEQFIKHVKDVLRLDPDKVKGVMHRIISEYIILKPISHVIGNTITHTTIKSKDGLSTNVDVSNLNPTVVLGQSNTILIDITGIESDDINKHIDNYPYLDTDLEDVDLSALLAINTIDANLGNKNIIGVLPQLTTRTTRFRNILEVGLDVEGGLITTLYMIEFTLVGSGCVVLSIIKVNLAGHYSDELFSYYDSFDERGFSLTKYNNNFEIISSDFIVNNPVNDEVPYQEKIEATKIKTVFMNIDYDIHKINYTGGVLNIYNRSEERSEFIFEDINEIGDALVSINKSKSIKPKDKGFPNNKFVGLINYIKEKYSDEKLTKNISEYAVNVTIHRNNSVFFKDKCSIPEVSIGDIDRIDLRVLAMNIDGDNIYSLDAEIGSDGCGCCKFEYYIKNTAEDLCKYKIIEIYNNIKIAATNSYIDTDIVSQIIIYSPVVGVGVGGKISISKSGRDNNRYIVMADTCDTKDIINTKGIFEDIESFSIKAIVNGDDTNNTSDAIEDILLDGPLLAESVVTHTEMLSVYKSIVECINTSVKFNVSQEIQIEFKK